MGNPSRLTRTATTLALGVLVLIARDARAQSELLPLPFDDPAPELSEFWSPHDTSRLARAPVIPEPMVFDLVRPLHARRGELEINALALFPLSRRRTANPPATDPFGFTPLSRDGGDIEWAPEIEFAFDDGAAVEFELPFEGSHLEAFKFAGQYTFGTAFDNQFIHGVQAIISPTVDFDEWDLTLLYLIGVRFDETWSALAMIGGRTAAGAPEFNDRTESLFNLTLFANVSEHVTLGFETNQARNMNGRSTLLLMPQWQYEASESLQIQAGVGVGFTRDDVIPLFGLRAILTR